MAGYFDLTCGLAARAAVARNRSRHGSPRKGSTSTRRAFRGGSPFARELRIPRRRLRVINLTAISARSGPEKRSGQRVTTGFFPPNKRRSFNEGRHAHAQGGFHSGPHADGPAWQAGRELAGAGRYFWPAPKARVFVTGLSFRGRGLCGDKTSLRRGV